MDFIIKADNNGYVNNIEIFREGFGQGSYAGEVYKFKYHDNLKCEYTVGNLSVAMANDGRLIIWSKDSDFDTSMFDSIIQKCKLNIAEKSEENLVK